MRSRRPAVLGLLGAAAACARSLASLPVDAGVTFAIHPDRGAFVVDRMHDGATGALARARWILTPDPPTFVLRTDGEVRAALWLVGHSRVLVRGETSTIAPRTGEVLSSWEDGALRLALWPRDGASLRTDTFRREGEGTGPRLLSRYAPMSIGPRGTYRATVRDAEGTAVGWMRARIGPSEQPARAYDAVLPPAVDDGLAAAASVALDTEIGWLEDHAVDAGGSEQEQRGHRDAEGQTRGEHADDHLRGAGEAAPDGSRFTLGHALHAVPIEHLDALLVGRLQRLDALLGVLRDRRDGLLGNPIDGERRQRELKDQHQDGDGDPHRERA